MKYDVLLYYLYTTIEDPIAFANWQRLLCEKYGLTGRIIIAAEGLNGTVEGTNFNISKYMKDCHTDPHFANVHFKRSAGTGDAFPKLSVKVRSEIVSAHLGEDDVNPNQLTGKYLTAEELHEWIYSDKEFYIIDMRNDYEHVSGHFAGSLLPKMRNFRELPSVLPELEHLRNKTVVTVCTGGVRCEKASGYLLKKGFKDVYQLFDGIVTYMEKYPNEDFKGSLYVFDNRVTMGFNQDSTEKEIIGRCELCGQPSENYINCANNECHRHFICCEKCFHQKGAIYCGKVCGAKKVGNTKNEVVIGVVQVSLISGVGDCLLYSE